MIEQCRVGCLYLAILIVQPGFASYLTGVLYPLTDQFMEVIQYLISYMPVELGVVVNPAPNLQIQLLGEPLKRLMAALNSTILLPLPNLSFTGLG